MKPIRKKPEDDPDWRSEFRHGKFDRSGYVRDIVSSNSKKDFEALNIPEETKPLLFPTEEGFLPVYLEGAHKLSDKFSRDGRWLCAELLYLNFERSGSQVGKLDEYFHRVGDVKENLDDQGFSLKANAFIVGILILSMVSAGYMLWKVIAGA